MLQHTGAKSSVDILCIKQIQFVFKEKKNFNIPFAQDILHCNLLTLQS